MAVRAGTVDIGGVSRVRHMLARAGAGRLRLGGGWPLPDATGDFRLPHRPVLPQTSPTDSAAIHPVPTSSTSEGRADNRERQHRR
ncbi:hypothetical protein [Streptomyces sp. NPDC088254]|uniref:hypothetical protein n=1 Tax=Streptomyces sp. NPDC088254 TaxID=3365847 RepID=UPI00382D7DD8